METTILHKVYSNNSKKSRLKRAKNKYMRVWDAEKMTYVKVKRTHTHQHLTKKQVKEIFKRTETPTKPVETPIKENKQKRENNTVKKNAMPARKAVTVHMYGKKLVWDIKTLRYKAA